ncbi:hypothetical protein IQ251_07850 [Saccharopolyspora sp. HNM0983]|uniref:Uncharacterized protein n=1 Tax=Saccharopolyspora montiporae TaxID=2781240 RepID=A0A929FX69_9PSEU|nr:hypothetical protein [Saccharopolyspora sp. HNM0983]MBE9374361.1 hypothetical protein [Saccharopolyspora sp. HNM0983]
MADRAAGPVTAGLNQLADLDRHERTRIMRQLREQYPVFRSMVVHVAIARSLGFASALVLALAVVLIAEGAPTWSAGVLIFAGIAGFGYAVVALTDSRFDLLLAVLGAHRTDELRSRLVTEQLYGEEQSEQAPGNAVAERVTGAR